MSNQRTSTSFDRLILAALAATAVLTIYILHGSAGQYLHDLGVNFEYVWTVDASIEIGSVHALVSFFLILGTMRFATSVAPASDRRSASVSFMNSAFVILPVLAFKDLIPGWNSPGFLSELLLYGAAMGIASYLQSTMGQPLFRTIDALKLEHARILAALQQLVWVFAILTGSLVIYFFTAFSNFVPSSLRNESAGMDVIVIHAIGGIYLMAGLLYLILAPMLRRISRIEIEAEGAASKSRRRR